MEEFSSFLYGTRVGSNAVIKFLDFLYGTRVGSNEVIKGEVTKGERKIAGANDLNLG